MRRQSGPGVKAGPPSGGLSVPAVLAACAAMVLAALFAFGVNVGELVRFAGFELAFVFLPGFLLLRALSPRERPLADALALAWPLGLAAEIGIFILAASIGARWLFDVYPAIVAALAARWAWRQYGRPSVPSLPRAVTSASVAAVAVLVTLAAVLVVSLAFFAPSPLPRDTAAITYFPDLIFHISLAAEILHHWPWMSPSVAGEALHYHIFANVDMAAVAQVTHVDLSTVAMRFQPTALISLAGVQLFALGRRLGGSRTAGVLALVLGLFAGEPNFSRLDIFGGTASVLGGLYSPSYELGAVFFLAILLVLVDDLTRPSARPAGDWALLALLALGAGGAKSSVLPIVAGGLALFVVLDTLVRRRISLRASTALGVVVALGAAIYVLIYRGGGQGIELRPFDFVRYSALTKLYKGTGVVHGLELVGGGLVVLAGLTFPVLGATLVGRRWLWPRSSATPERLLMLMFVAAAIPFLLVSVPGDSQAYFVVYGYLAGAVVAAAGIARVLEPMRLRLRELAWPALACAAGVVVTGAVLWKYRSRPDLVAGFVLLAVTVVVAAWLLRGAARRLGTRPWRRYASLVIAIAVLLTPVAEIYQLTLPTLESWAHHDQPRAGDVLGLPDMTAALYRGLVWVRDHTKPSDVLAVNNHYLTSAQESRFYYFSAFAERRVALESWDYTPEGFAYLAEHRNPQVPTQFQGLLYENNLAFEFGSAAAIAVLHTTYGVNYLIVDRLHGPATSALVQVAHVVYSNAAIVVLRVS